MSGEVIPTDPLKHPIDTSKYLMIADELRVQIMSGEVPPGARLPGENELIRRYGVARMTARQALSVLQSEGLTVTRKGAGVFVRDYRPIRRRVGAREWPNRDPVSAAAPGMRSPFPTRDDGQVPAVDQDEVDQGSAPPVIAQALGLQVGSPVWIRRRRFMLDGKPVMLATSYLPACLPEPGRLPGSAGFTEPAEPAGFTEPAEPAGFTEELRARMPLRKEAGLLRLPAGTPVIVLCRTTFDPAGQPLEFTKMTMDGDAYVLEYGHHPRPRNQGLRPTPLS